MKPLKIATVFSGIGSIEHALQRLDIPHNIEFACDIDKYCKQTYFENFKINENQWYNDIQIIDGKKYNGKIDLFVGGSPCQSFSMVGKRKGLDDDRGNLFFEFARLVDEIKPKVFIFENVKGLLSHNSGKTWITIENRIKELGYQYYKQVLNARDYGIPQNRERLFVVGFLEKQDFNFPKPLPLEITMQDLLMDNPDAKYFLPEKGIKFVSDEKNLKKRYTQIDGKIALCQKRNQQFNWHGDFVMDKYYLSDKVKDYVMSTGTKGFYSKPETDLEVARPLLSTMAKMHRAGVDNYITRGDRLRKLTPRECLRLMGFSDDFQIVVSDTQAYKQAGNTIVVDVLINILKCIYECKER
jgi:DNA (cytosine-5)-methyltransferase 1